MDLFELNRQRQLEKSAPLADRMRPDNIEDFACKMAELMRNQDLRIKFGKNAVEDVRQYSPEAVIARWNRLIDETVKGIK